MGCSFEFQFLYSQIGYDNVMDKRAVTARRSSFIALKSLIIESSPMYSHPQDRIPLGDTGGEKQS